MTLVVEDGADTGRLRESIDRFGPAGLPVEVVPVTGHGREARAQSILAAAGRVATPVFVTLPSDAVFVRTFGMGDFVDGDGRPRLHLTEDAERRVAGTSPLTDAERRYIVERAGLGQSRVLWPAGPLAMRADEVRALCADWADIAAVPDVEAWYSVWRQSVEGPSLDWHEPVFLLLGADGIAVDVSMSGATESDVARGYLGYVGQLPTSEDPLAQHVPTGRLLNAAARSAYAKAPRVRRAIDRITGRSG